MGLGIKFYANIGLPNLCNCFTEFAQHVTEMFIAMSNIDFKY